MDLLSALPEEVFIEIASYLSSRDIQEASLVCKEWYQMFGQSNECMEKVSLIYSFINCDDDANSLLRSSRQYRNFTIKLFEETLQDPKIERKMKTILKKFSKSIANLVTSQVLQLDFELPNLEELKLYYFYPTDEEFTNFRASSLDVMFPNLTKLDIKYFSLEHHVRNLQDVINGISKLKSLTVNHHELITYNFPVSECKFKLEKLVIDYKDYSIIDLEYSNFVKHHQSTLKFLEVRLVTFAEVPFILMELPVLHTLKIEQLIPPNYKIPELPENSSLKCLIIKCYNSYKHNEELVQLFTKLKSLEELTISELHSSFIPKLIACKSLTKVRYNMAKDVTDKQKNDMKNNEKIKFIRITD